MIKAVIFDFDGVIHNTFSITYALNKKLNPNLSVEEYKDDFNGNLYGSLKKKKHGENFFKEYFELQHSAFEGLKIEESIKRELISLEKDYSLFIITSNKEKTLTRYFQDNNIVNLFKEILGYETHISKEIKFKMIMDKHGLNENNTIFVTDTLGDILEANKLNIKSIAVDFGYHEKERLQRGNPLAIVSNFEDISQIIKKN